MRGPAVAFAIAPERYTLLFVKVPSGRTLSLYSRLSSTVAEFKQLIQAITALPAHHIDLICFGRHPDDAASLTDCHVQNESTLHMRPMHGDATGSAWQLDAQAESMQLHLQSTDPFVNGTVMLVPPACSVAQLKARLAATTGLAPEHLHCFRFRHALDDDTTTLSSLQSGCSVLSLVVVVGPVLPAGSRAIAIEFGSHDEEPAALLIDDEDTIEIISTRIKQRFGALNFTLSLLQPPSRYLHSTRTLRSYLGADTPATNTITLRVTPVLRGDIGLFVHADEAVFGSALHSTTAAAAPGAWLLQKPVLPALPPAPADVLALIHNVHAFFGSTLSVAVPIVDGSVVVPAAARALLKAAVDRAWHTVPRCAPSCHSSTLAASVLSSSVPEDFKLLLSSSELIASVGEAVFAKLLCALGAPAQPPVIVLRRTIASQRWIGFHTDVAAHTVHVPLGDDGCVGGVLLFALSDGSLLRSPRVPGVPVSHDGNIVHGVTQLAAGTRYGLFLLRERTL